MELKHLCHEHPLKLTEDKNDDGMKNFCHGCYQWITCSAYYSCTNCAFFLHKLCAKLPTEIKHPMYLKSPLTLHPHTPNYTWQCHVCHKYLNRFQYCCSPFTRDVNFHPQTPNYAWSCHVCHNFLLGFQYCCSPFTHDTNFCVHMRCAARAISVEHKFHEHPLTPFLRPALFDCHACGTEHKHKGLSYICSTCDFWIHEDCAFLPTTFKLSTHVHSLTLTTLFDPREHLCRICHKQIRINSWNYQCKGCGYYVHVDCSTKPKSRESESVMKVEDFDVNNLIHLPMPDDSVNLIDQFVEQFSLRHANNKREAELNHLNHDHPLILFDAHSDDNLCSGSKSSIPPNQQKNAKICDACVLPISAPFYNCGQCNLFLHRRCVDLPNEIQHPCHPHPLLSTRTIGSARLYICRGCGKLCNGLLFQCTLSECIEKYCLDIKCASLPSSIVHEVHEHPLHLRPDCADEGCVACNRRELTFSYGCGICNFTLHWHCALLPRTIKHRYDKHPFTLTYAPIKDGPEEYICEFCEEDIDPEWWFYHCIDCDQSACARCIYKEENEFSNIKFGTIGNFDSHPHPLTLVQVTNKGLLCAMCPRTHCYGDMTGYICVQCNIMFHRWCVLRRELDFSD